MNKELLEALKTSDIDRLEALIAKGVDIKQKNELGFTPLLIAACHGQIKMFEHLLKKKYAQVTEKNIHGSNVLILAAYYGQIEMFEYIVKNHNVDVKEKNNNGDTVLHFAAANGQIAMFEYLLKNNYATLNEKDKEGNTALLLAAGNGRIEMVEYLLKKNPATINERNKYGDNVLLIATCNGHIKMVDFLLKNNYATINEKNKYGDTLFLIAAHNGQIEMMDYLLTQWNADLEDRDTREGANALSLAALKGDTKTVAYLLEKGAYIDMPLKNGKTTRDVVEEHYYNKTKPLLRAGVMLLQLASGASISVAQQSIVQTLKKGLNARQFKTGHTALHLAILNNQTALVTLLLERGADLSLPNRRFDTPLRLLNESKHPYFQGLHAYYKLCQIEKEALNQKRQRPKMLQEMKEFKEIKESIEFNMQSELVTQNSSKIKLLDERSSKLFYDLELLSMKVSPEEAGELCLKMAKLLIKVDSPFFNPARAYKILNGCINKQNLEEAYLNEARKMLLEILIAKRIIFTAGTHSDEPTYENRGAAGIDCEESKESFEYRLKCIIKHILHSQSIYNESLGSHIVQYVNGDKNCLSGLEGIKGKTPELYFSIIETLKKQAEELRKTKLENDKLKQENEAQRQKIQALEKLLQEKQSSAGISTVSASTANANTALLVSFQAQTAVQKGKSTPHEAAQSNAP